MSFPPGLITVVQTPFTAAGTLDPASLGRLVDDAVLAGADALLAPVVASEVQALSDEERGEVVRVIVDAVGGRVPLIVGASAEDPVVSRHHVAVAEEVGAAGVLVAVPDALRDDGTRLAEFLTLAIGDSPLPLMLQDLQWDGPGLPLEAIQRLVDALPTLAGLKIETVPAGPKYTAVRERFGSAVFICGGWAVLQLIEALDRGVDGMVPESSMIRVYRWILDAYAGGRRDLAITRFRRLLPVLAFANQELRTSMALFKRLLWRKGIFTAPDLRPPAFAWDAYNLRIADELIDLYLELEQESLP